MNSSRTKTENGFYPRSEYFNTFSRNASKESQFSVSAPVTKSVSDQRHFTYPAYVNRKKVRELKIPCCTGCRFLTNVQQQPSSASRNDPEEEIDTICMDDISFFPGNDPATFSLLVHGQEKVENFIVHLDTKRTRLSKYTALDISNPFRGYATFYLTKRYTY